MSTITKKSAIGMLALAVALVASGCSGSGGGDSSDTSVFVDPPATPEQLPTEEDLRDRFEGTVTEPSDLPTGACFNQYAYLDRNDLPAELTTVVGCTRPHNAQVYTTVLHNASPGTLYPGEEALDLWAQTQCYRRFEPFVGLAYELSQLEVGTIIPSRDTWEGEDPQRQVICYVFSYELKLIIGNMAGIAL